MLSAIFDDAYALVVAPRLAIRDAARLDGILVGPAGMRVITVRDWVGHYRVRGRAWEFDTRWTQGWIPCRTNPSWDANALCDGVARWAPTPASQISRSVRQSSSRALIRRSCSRSRRTRS